ncbi:hypothetical protein AYO44_10920 [Planctomycetaceae bacterium SCGC AG-212-F19]|nr:hypothetical protein AYO44_10920 [Planctomycetaceae bacterium SCGC AG-212-F19]
MTKGWHISRRTMLRGLGAAVAIPWLEAMGPTLARAAGPTSKPPLRTVFMYHPLGTEVSALKGVKGQGKDMQLSTTLQALEPVKEHLLILDGLNGRPHPPGGHNRSACLWLSSALPGKADTRGVETDITLDQVLAPKLSAGARQKSLELSCSSFGDLMHASFVSWRAPGAPMGAETNPRDVFERMFGDAKRDFYRKSILDVVAEDTHTLKKNLGRSDQRRLDEYLEGVRSLEQQIRAFEQGAAQRPAPKMARPEQLPQSLRDYVKLMLDLLVVALQTDYTRVLSCALGDENDGSRVSGARTLNDFGIDKAQFGGQVEAKYLDYGHHQCTHDPKPTLPIIHAIDRWYVDHLSYFLQKLQSIPEGDGTLLDHSIVVYGCTNSSGRLAEATRGIIGWPGHSIADVACIVAGKGGGLLPKTGRHLEYYGKDQKDSNSGVPLSNLWLTLLQLVGIERKEFGRSTGTLAGLA